MKKLIFLSLVFYCTLIQFCASPSQQEMFFKSKQKTFHPINIINACKSPVLSNFLWPIIQKNNLMLWLDTKTNSLIWDLDDTDQTTINYVIHLLNAKLNTTETITVFKNYSWETLFNIHKLVNFLCINQIEQFLIALYAQKMRTDSYVIKQDQWPFPLHFDDQITTTCIQYMEQKDPFLLLQCGHYNKKNTIDLTTSGSDLANNCVFITFSPTQKGLLCAHTYGRIEKFCLDKHTFCKPNHYTMNTSLQPTKVSITSDGCGICTLDSNGYCEYNIINKSTSMLTSTERINNAVLSANGEHIVYSDDRAVYFQKTIWTFPESISLPTSFFSNVTIRCIAPNDSGDKACVLFSEQTFGPTYEINLDHYLTLIDSKTKKIKNIPLRINNTIEITACLYHKDIIFVAYWDEETSLASLELFNTSNKHNNFWKLTLDQAIPEKILSIACDTTTTTLALLHPTTISLWEKKPIDAQQAALLAFYTEHNDFLKYMPHSGWACETLNSFPAQVRTHVFGIQEESSFCTIS